MANEIVRDVTRSDQSVVRTGEYQSPGSIGDILAGITNAFGTLIDAGSKGHGGGGGSSKADYSQIIPLWQELKNKQLSTPMKDSQLRIEEDKLVRYGTALGFSPDQIKNAQEISGYSPLKPVASFEVESAASRQLAEMQLKDRIATSQMGNTGTPEERSQKATEVLTTYLSNYYSKRETGKLSVDEQRLATAPLSSQLGLMYKELNADLTAEIQKSPDRVLDSQGLLNYKRNKISELVDLGWDMSIASEVVEQGTSLWKATLDKNLSDMETLKKEQDTVKEILSNREAIQFLQTPQQYKWMGKDITLTGAQYATYDKYAPNTIQALVAQNQLTMLPKLASEAKPVFLEKELKYFIGRGNAQKVTDSTENTTILKNVEEGIKEAGDKVWTDTLNTPRDILLDNNVETAPNKAWLNAYGSINPAKIDKMFENDPIGKEEQAKKGPRTLQSAIDTVSNNKMLVQLDDNNKIHIYEMSLIRDLTKPTINTGNIVNVTDDGKFIELMSNDVVRTRNLSKDIYDNLRALINMGYSPKDARDILNKEMIMSSKGAQKMLSFYKRKEAGDSDIRADIPLASFSDEDVVDFQSRLKGSRQSLWTAAQPAAEVANVVGQAPGYVVSKGVIEPVSRASELITRGALSMFGNPKGLYTPDFDAVAERAQKAREEAQQAGEEGAIDIRNTSENDWLVQPASTTIELPAQAHGFVGTEDLPSLNGVKAETQNAIHQGKITKEDLGNRTADEYATDTYNRIVADEILRIQGIDPEHTLYVGANSVITEAMNESSKTGKDVSDILRDWYYDIKSEKTKGSKKAKESKKKVDVIPTEPDRGAEEFLDWHNEFSRNNPAP